MGDKRAVDPLIRALSDDSWRVRYYAAEALGQLGDMRTVSPWVKVSTDEDADVRM